MYYRPSCTQRYSILYSNVRLASLLTFVAVVAVAVYIFANQPPDDSCEGLLTDGTFGEGDVWQPKGCRMHNYTQKETLQCMNTWREATGSAPRLVFVGDSRVRDLFNGVNLMVGVTDLLTAVDEDEVEYIRKPEDGSVETVYYWRPLLREDIPAEVVDRLKENLPSAVVFDSIVHFLRNYPVDSKEARAIFRARITKLAKELDDLPSHIPVLFLLSEPFNLEIMNPKNHSQWLPEIITKYNNIAKEVLTSTRVTVVDSVRRIGTLRNWDYTDGIHAAYTTVNYFAEILLNYFCNSYLSSPPHGTCCIPTVRTKPTIEHVCNGVIVVCFLAMVNTIRKVFIPVLLVEASRCQLKDPSRLHWWTRV